jgi:hypothetical protein
VTAARRLSPDAARGSREVWGWCGVCERWFYPRQGTTEPLCPVCAAPAAKTAEQPES